MESRKVTKEEIPQNVFKLLSDKTQEKKKDGMVQLENFLTKQIQVLNEQEMMVYIDKFKTLSESSQPMNIRKSSFLGYISLINVIRRQNGDELTHPLLVDRIMQNILVSLKDNDPRIVSAAAECLYNIMNYFKDYVLLNFNNFLEGLLALVTVQDSDVRGIAQNLDSSLKGVINYAFQGDLPKDFDLLTFFKIIIDKINLKHPNIKCVVVSWISCINQIPEIKLINILHLFLPELFNMLAEQNADVNKSAEDCLKDFYGEIESGFDTLSYDVEVKILEILIEKSQINHQKTRLTAFKWILLFLQKYSFLFIQTSEIKNYSKNTVIKNSLSVKTPNQDSVDKNTLLTPKEPLFDSESSKQDDFSLNNANSNFECERKYPFPLFGKILDIVIMSSSNSDNEISSVANEINTTLMTIVEYFGECNSNVKLFEEVLTKYFNEKEPSVIELIFKWIEKLFNKFHEETFSNFNSFMQKFTTIITHEDYVIFDQVLNIICTIAKYKEEYIEVIIFNIIETLRKTKDLLKNRGTVIVTKLCNALKVDKIYSTFANVLLRMNDTDFVGRMINILDLFLLTAKDTEQLRSMLKNVKKSKEPKDKEFFEKIFRTWCINPVSSLILCLIAEYFELSYYLLIKFGELKFNQESYLELAQLVQLLESSVFINIRIYLLEPKKNKYLVKTLYGILLILPQGKSYQALLKRLKHMEIMLRLDKFKKEKNEIIDVNQKEVSEYVKIFENTHKALKEKDDKIIKQNEDNINSIKKE